MSEKDIEYIRVAAYYIWENEGRPEGKSEEIWWKACNQMKNWNCSCKSKKAVAKKACAKKSVAKPAAKVAAKPVVKVASKPVAKVTLKPAVKAVVKPVAKVAEKPVVKLAAKPAVKLAAKPAVKAASVKVPATKKLAKSKISPVPVKSSAKIITPLYGSLKK